MTLILNEVSKSMIQIEADFESEDFLFKMNRISISPITTSKFKELELHKG
jgi:predicted RNA-binding protein with PUA-like domain